MPDVTSSPAPDPGAPIYLVGANGNPNFGDEFTAAAWLRFLARARPEAEVWLDCHHPGTASHLFRDLHPRLRTTDTLWQIVHDTKDMDDEAAHAFIDRVATTLGSPRYDLNLMDAHAAGTVHFIGGGYFNAMWPQHHRMLRTALRIRDVSGARLYATGLGVTPVDDRSDAAELREFDHVSVRDAASAEVTGAALGPADALLGLRDLPAIREWTPPDPDEQGEVWVCLQSDVAEEGAFDAAVEALRSYLSSDAVAGRSLHYVEGRPGWDRTAFERLDGLIPEENFLPFTRLWREGFPARPGQVWLTSRFTFHLLAAACGARGSAIEISGDYYRTKHESLTELTGWSLTPVGEAKLAEPAGTATVASRASSLAAAKLEEAQRLYPAP